MDATLLTLAEALRYPTPSSADDLRVRLDRLRPEGVRADLGAFLARVERMSLEEWEELYVSSFDMDPDAAPYLGWQVWREEPRRGELLVDMARRLAAAKIDLDGELPDHLVPVLRYVAVEPGSLRGDAPLLEQSLSPALESITRSLGAADPDNPYLFVLEGLSKALVTAEPLPARSENAGAATADERRPL